MLEQQQIDHALLRACNYLMDRCNREEGHWRDGREGTLSNKINWLRPSSVKNIELRTVVVDINQ